ncbi:MAG TPA: helix-turn-helix transcriptional regulator [Pirellulales bacterium]
MRQEAQIQSEFGKALRKVRMKVGISQEALADLAGIHRTYVGDVERGERNISLINMMRLSAALEVRLSQVVLDMERNLS